MFAQDTSIEQVLPWPGFGYNGTGAGDQPFQGFFQRSPTGPIPLNAAKAWFLQGKLVTETKHRVKVVGSSEDGFAVLAGVSTNRTKVQILLNNYQLDYNIATEITAQMVRIRTGRNTFSHFVVLKHAHHNTQLPILNTSASAYPLLQENGRKFHSHIPVYRG